MGDIFFDPFNGTFPISSNIEWTAGTVLKTIAFSVIILLAASGNLFVLTAVFLYPKIRATTTNYFITNLAVADFLLATSVAPFTAVKQLQEPFWSFGETFCDTWSVLGTWYCSASILSLVVISVDRYVGVTRPLRYPVLITRKRAFLMVVFTWVVSFMLSGPPMLIWPEWQPEPTMCISNLHLPHVLIMGLGSFALPAVILIFVYWRVYKVAHEYEKSLRKGEINNNEGEGSSRLRVHFGGYNGQGATSATESSVRERDRSTSCPITRVSLMVTKFHAQKRIAFHLAFVGGIFLFCWAPFFTALLVAAFQELNAPLGVGPPKSTQTALKVLVWLGYLNSSLNPFIYVASSRQFRIAFSRMFCCLRNKEQFTTDISPSKNNISNISED